MKRCGSKYCSRVCAVAIVGLFALSSCSDDNGGKSTDLSTDFQVEDSSGIRLDYISIPDVFLETTKNTDVMHSDTKVSCDDSVIGTGVFSGTIGGKTYSAGYASGTAMSHTHGGKKDLTGYMIMFHGNQAICSVVTSMPEVAFINICKSAPGTYSLGIKCKTETGLDMLNRFGLSSGDDATGGTVTIDAIDPLCGGTLKGSFSAEFTTGTATETITGTFNTISCQPTASQS